MPKTMKNKSGSGKSRKHVPRGATRRNPSQGHGKGNRTMKGGWVPDKFTTWEQIQKYNGYKKTWSFKKKKITDFSIEQLCADAKEIIRKLSKSDERKTNFCTSIMNKTNVPELIQKYCENQITSEQVSDLKDCVINQPSVYDNPKGPIPTNVYESLEETFLSDGKLTDIINGINKYINSKPNKLSDYGIYALIINATDTRKILMIINVNGINLISLINIYNLYKCADTESQQDTVKTNLSKDVKCQSHIKKKSPQKTTNPGGKYYFYINNNGNVIMCIKPRCSATDNNDGQPAKCYNTSLDNFPFSLIKLQKDIIMIKLPKNNNGMLESHICKNEKMNDELIEKFVKKIADIQNSYHINESGNAHLSSADNTEKNTQTTYHMSSRSSSNQNAYVTVGPRSPPASQPKSPKYESVK